MSEPHESDCASPGLIFSDVKGIGGEGQPQRQQMDLLPLGLVLKGIDGIALRM